MSRQDPGAATGAGVYPQDPPCATDGCGDSAAVHAIGDRGGQRIRTGCSRSGCTCTRYTAPTTPPRQHRCRTCGAPMSAIERARLEERRG